jgi:hypothetical protein
LAHRPSDRVEPPEDTTNVISRSFAFDGERMRYAWKGAVWHFELERFDTVDHQSAFDGTASKTLAYYGGIGQDYPQGAVVDDSGMLNRTLWNLKPIVLAYRPLDSTLVWFEEGELRITMTGVAVDDRPCVVLESHGPRREVTLWVDPSRDFHVVRYEYAERGNLKSHFEVRYHHAGADGWVPERWEHLTVGPGRKPAMLWSGSVDRFAINPAIDISEFQIEFPVGALVWDGRTNQSFLVREDGARPILPEEMDAGTKYEDLMATEPGEMLRAEYGRPQEGRANVLWTALGLIGATLAIGCVARRTMARRASRTSS